MREPRFVSAQWEAGKSIVRRLPNQARFGGSRFEVDMNFARETAIKSSRTTAVALQREQDAEAI